VRILLVSAAAWLSAQDTELNTLLFQTTFKVEGRRDGRGPAGYGVFDGAADSRHDALPHRFDYGATRVGRHQRRHDHIEPEKAHQQRTAACSVSD